MQAKVCHTSVKVRATPAFSEESMPSQDPGIFTGYASDQSEDRMDETDSEDKPDEDNEHGSQCKDTSTRDTAPRHAEMPNSVPPISGFGVLERKRHCDATKATVPALKRQKRDTTVRVRRNGHKNEVWAIRSEAMEDLEKRINSARSDFDGGLNGLQARRARAIHSYLHMLVRNDRRKIEASEWAAEAQGFAAQWGGQQIRSWTNLWITDRKLPGSRRGRHIKLFTLLEDPDICAELRSYVRSNKWAIDPAKLANFSTQTMVPKAAGAYGTDFMKTKIPDGLKRYLEHDLFPRICQGHCPLGLYTDYTTRQAADQRKSETHTISTDLLTGFEDEEDAGNAAKSRESPKLREALQGSHLTALTQRRERGG
jgi:hypothetical protein